MNKDQKITLLLIVGISTFFIGFATNAVRESANPRVGNVGRIRIIGFEVYRDENLTEILTFIDWGIVDVGGNSTVNAWFKNTGNDAQKMVMWTDSWSPSNASDWMDLSWDYDGSWIPVNGTRLVAFTLSVDPFISGIEDFSFDIWIRGVH